MPKDMAGFRLMTAKFLLIVTFTHCGAVLFQKVNRYITFVVIVDVLTRIIFCLLLRDCIMSWNRGVIPEKTA